MQVRSLNFALAVVVSLSLALVVACGGSSSSPATPTTPPSGGGGSTTATVTVSIVGMNGDQSFSPNPVSVKVGQSIAWHNSDVITHTATQDGGGFNTGSIAPGTTSSPITMNTAGTFSYHCSIHPSMVGTVTVTQ